MRYLFWLIRIVLFIVLFGFAIKNTDITALRFYLGYQWQAPLVLILLIFFVSGVAIGVFAGLRYIFQQRREILALKKELRVRVETLDDHDDLPRIVDAS